MRERFAKKREPVCCDWAQRREWTDGWRGKCVDGRSREDGDRWREKKRLTTSVFWSKDWGGSQYVEVPLKCCAETVPHVAFVHGYTHLAALGALLLFSHAQQTQPGLSQSQFKHSIHKTYIRRYKRTFNAQEAVCHRKMFNEAKSPFSAFLKAQWRYCRALLVSVPKLRTENDKYTMTDDKPRLTVLKTWFNRLNSSNSYIILLFNPISKPSKRKRACRFNIHTSEFMQNHIKMFGTFKIHSFCEVRVNVHKTFYVCVMGFVLPL